MLWVITVNMNKFPIFDYKKNVSIWYSKEEIKDVIYHQVSSRQIKGMLECLAVWEELTFEQIISDVRYSLERRNRIWYLIIR
jgi:predicted site-specific integrase-resolvase